MNGDSRNAVSRLRGDRPSHAMEATLMSPVHERIARGTASPVLVTDERWRIVALNPGAERLFGCSSLEAQGQSCNALLRARDRFGNHLPSAQCDIGSMTRRGEPVHPFELDVVSAGGEMIHAACSIIVLHDRSVCRIVHILTPIPDAAESLAARSEKSGNASQAQAGANHVAGRYGLTARENDVLRSLANGNDCRHIADALFISLSTVRNHVHNLFRKMEVHSQVEAVALAYRERLI